MQRDLEGKTFVVTGSNTGIGRATAEALGARGAHVVLANRSREKTEPVLAAIAASGGKASFVALDLSDLAATKRAADELAALPRIDVLINNAGLAGLGGLTAQGFELSFGVNHLAPFVLTETLLPKLRESAPSRIVFVASKSHYQTRGIDFSRLHKKTVPPGLGEYAVSKLANVLYSAELSRRLAGSGVTTYSLHPGVVASDVWRDFPKPVAWLMKRFMLTNEQGAATTLHCATSPEAARETGLYYDKSKPVTPSRAARDVALGDELVRKSREYVAEYLRA